MIALYNRQRLIPVNSERIRADAELILNRLEYSGYDLALVITNDATIRRYNREFRHVDKPTDILSFPYYSSLKAGERIQPTSEEEHILGDLIISAPYVMRAAAELNVTFDERMRVLLVHGIFHLLGYDHIQDEDFEIMQVQENQMLAFLNEKAPILT